MQGVIAQCEIQTAPSATSENHFKVRLAKLNNRSTVVANDASTLNYQSDGRQL